MNLFTKILCIGTFCLALVACGGSSGFTQGGGGNVTTVPSINIGNISAIPLNGNQTSTSLIVTNNSGMDLFLADGTINQDARVMTIKTRTSNRSAEYGIINASQCDKLQAHGTCSVSIIPPTTPGNYLLTLDFTDGSKVYSSSQVVVFTDTIPPANGFTYSNLNNNLYNAPGGNTTYVIPFILDNDYQKLYAYTNNPAFQASFNCPGGTIYTKGDLCNLYIRVSGLANDETVTATATVSTEPNPTPPSNIQNGAKKMHNMKGNLGFSFNTPITVSNSVAGNIVTSAFNVVVNPANGSSPQTVTLLNNGSATVSNISITPVGGIISIINNGPGSCSALGNSLTAGSSCFFSVNANTQTSGSNTVNITYDNGGTGNAHGITTFTVVYISGTPGPGMSMTTGQGSLQNAVVGFTSALNIQVANTGNVALTNVGFTNITGIYGSQFTYSPASTCATNGTQTLPVSGQCTLVVDYLPTVAQTTPLPLTINSVAKYVNPNNPTESLSYSGSSFGTTYSAFVSNAFVYMTPNAVSYAIRADNRDTATESIVVANFGGQSATLSSPSYTESGLNSISSSVHITDGCAGVTLTPNRGNTCTITIVYGPVATAQALTQGYLYIPYRPIPTLSSTYSAFSAQSFQAESAALVTVTGPVESGALGGSGAGTSVSPYTFYNSPVASKPIILKYTYTNSGTVSASNFVVSLNAIPIGWTVVPGLTTCGYGASSTTLTTVTPCTVAITAISPGTFAQPYNSTSPINVVTPGFSYTDPNTGLNTGPAVTTTTYVTPMLFAQVASSAPGGLSSSILESFNITFTSSSGGDSAQYPITITIPSSSLPSGPGTPIYVTSTNTCTISSLTGTCTINVTNIAGAVAGGYTYQYWVTPATLTPSSANSIINTFGFTLN